MNTSDSRIPIYRILDMDSGNFPILAKEISGFFICEDEPSPSVIHLTDVWGVDLKEREIKRAELQIIDSRGDRIGAYYLGGIRIVESAIKSSGGGGYIEYSFEGYTCEYPKAGEVWKRWASGHPLEFGEWAQYSDEYHASWLHVSQTAWFTRYSECIRLMNYQSGFIDGEKITTKESFYCAIGEAVNGPGGYFGSNLDALAACLSATRGTIPPLQIKWNSILVSREILGEIFVSRVMKILNEADVSLVCM